MTLLEKVRRMLINSGLPKKYWAEALHIAKINVPLQHLILRH